MAIRTELQVRLPNSPGSLAKVTSVLISHQVRIIALSLEASGIARLLVDNPEGAYGALTQDHMRVDKRDVIYALVAGRSIPALLRSIGEAGVNLDYVYASSLDTDGMTALVLGVEDAVRASAAAGI